MYISPAVTYVYWKLNTTQNSFNPYIIGPEGAQSVSPVLIRLPSIFIKTAQFFLVKGDIKSYFLKLLPICCGLVLLRMIELGHRGY